MPEVFAGATMKPKRTIIVKTVSEDSLSSSSSVVGATQSPPSTIYSEHRAVESVPYLTVYYPPPPPFITIGGPHAPTTVEVHNGVPQSAAYFHPPPNRQHSTNHPYQVPYGYVLVPAYHEPPRFVTKNFQSMPYCENMPPVPPHMNQVNCPAQQNSNAVDEGLSEFGTELAPPTKKAQTQRKQTLALAKAALVQSNVAPPLCSSMDMGFCGRQAQEKKQGTCAATLLLEAARVHEEREIAKKKQANNVCDKSSNIIIQACGVHSNGTAGLANNMVMKKSPHKVKLKNSKLPLSKCEKSAFRKHHWSTKEDEILRDAVTKLGAKRWASIAALLPGRLGKHCRNRWCQHLAPHVRKGVWDLKEDYAIIKGHAKFGNRWSLIARELPGRTDNAIKNRFFGSMKTKIEYYLTHQRGKLEVDGAGRYDYQNDVEGCLWMVHSIPNENNFVCYSADHCEYVTAFAAKWKQQEQLNNVENREKLQCA